ncbi:hypothetical protein L7H23_00830 [Sphingopyxis sp. BSN-002]|uniref:hypothetical protein n=1 Tax=Sphingopyxis sp. BSN-002 TaxID=2911495 RepID=UPI001EDAFA07|nr:hypothetical protein [Sphingopyxis sp. BSN-002]UKK84680.1 hypothetical protein L7H23_00830 [Sphingopyxis sp. BSN-002]
MMSIDLPNQAPPSPGALKLPKRPAPCAGLFGWRKDGASTRADGKPAQPGGRDFPLA